MVSVYQIKKKFQALLSPIVERLSARGVTANQVTINAVLLSVGTAIVVWVGSIFPSALILVPVLLFIRMAMNAIDGMLAREHNMKSDLGLYLNELGDLVSDALIYLPFMLLPGVSPILVIAIVILALVSEAAGILAIQLGVERRYDGPMGKSDRAVAFGTLALILGLGVERGLWLDLVLGVILGLLCLTIRNRAKSAMVKKAG